MSNLYCRETEAADILRDLISLRKRVERLVRNLDFPLHDAASAQKHLSLAIDAMAAVRPGPQGADRVKE